MMDDSECGCEDRAPVGEYWVCPDCDAEWHGDEEQLDTVSPASQPGMENER